MMRGFFQDRKRLLRATAIITGVLWGVSLIPVIYCAFFDYATGDDLLYGSVIKNAIRDGKSFFQTIECMCIDIKREYYTFQGAWSVSFLNRLQPGIWGERLYTLTPIIAIVSLCSSTGYLFYIIIEHIMKLGKNVFLIVFSIISFILIQYMPFPRGGIFWYTGMINYTFSFACTMLTIAWAVKYIETGYTQFMVGLIITMIYLGGAGLPTIVLAAFIFFVMIITACCIKDISNRKRRLMLGVPFVCEMISFAINAAAPGNKARGGSSFGFSIQRVISTLYESIYHGGAGISSFFISTKILFIAIPVVVIVIVIALGDKKIEFEFKNPIFATIILFIASCTVYAPEMFTGDKVSGGISGGVYDTYFFTFIICLVLWIIYMTGWGMMCIQKNDRHVDKYAGVCGIALVIMLVCTNLLAKPILRDTTDMICIDFIKSGQLEDFDTQMKERLAILENQRIYDAVVPEMNNEQGPFMHMALMRNPNEYTNSVTARFYGKKSVVAVPREEYNRRKNKK